MCNLEAIVYNDRNLPEPIKYVTNTNGSCNIIGSQLFRTISEINLIGQYLFSLYWFIINLYGPREKVKIIHFKSAFFKLLPGPL